MEKKVEDILLDKLLKSTQSVQDVNQVQDWRGKSLLIQHHLFKRYLKNSEVYVYGASKGSSLSINNHS